MLSKIICHLTSLEDMQQITSGEKLGKSYHRLLYNNVYLTELFYHNHSFLFYLLPEAGMLH